MDYKKGFIGSPVSQIATLWYYRTHFVTHFIITDKDYSGQLYQSVHWGHNLGGTNYVKYK